MKPLFKMQTKGGKWSIKEGSRTVTFANANDAWQYITLMMSVLVGAKVNPIHKASQPYPVRSLVPHPIRGL